ALPLLVNGRAVSSAALADGDRLTLRTVELLVAIELNQGLSPPVPVQQGRVEQLAEQERQLQQQQQHLKEQTHELEADRAIWYRRRAAIERECLQQREAAHVLSQRLQEQESELAGARTNLAQQTDALAQQQRELQTRQDQLTQQQQALATAQQEL